MAIKVLRASDLAEYCYCRRAWWLNRQGVSTDATHQLRYGSDWHEAHVRQVLRHRLLQLLGYLFVLGGAVAAAVMVVMQLLG